MGSSGTNVLLQGPRGANFFTSLLTNWVPQKDYLALLVEKQCQPRGGSTRQLDQHRTLHLFSSVV